MIFQISIVDGHTGGGGTSIGPPTGARPIPLKITKPCLQVGVSVSGTAAAGTGGNILAATGGVAGALDIDDGQTFFAPSGGVVIGGTAQPGGVGSPSQEGIGIGAYYDFGPSLFLSRTRDSGDLTGTSTTHMFGSPIISLQMGMNEDGTWQTLEIGPPAVGLGYFRMQTATARPSAANISMRGRPPILCGE